MKKSGGKNKKKGGKGNKGNQTQNETEPNRSNSQSIDHTNEDSIQSIEGSSLATEHEEIGQARKGKGFTNFKQQLQHDKATLFQQKIKFQKRALFRKNATLQMRQVGTNLCQIITPLIGIVVLATLRYLGSTSLQLINGKTLYIPIPYLLNVPTKPFAVLGEFFNITDCEQWYMYQFAPEADEATREFWGFNEGLPIDNPSSKGILDANINIIEYPCKDSNRTVPYFKELDRESHESVNEYIYEVLLKMNVQKMVYFDYNFKVDFREDLPDGAFTIHKASEEKLKYRMQINDYRVWQYHRNNGVTKIGFNQRKEEDKNTTEDGIRGKLYNHINSKERKERGKQGMYITRAIEGQLQVADMVNQAYIREFFPDTHILTGVQFMPFQPSMDMEMERMINLIGMAVYPMNLCLSLPVFIYTIVMEKEMKLLENMKINGLKMRNYWLVNFAFDYLMYWITLGIYWFTSAVIFQMSFFTNTGFNLLFTVFFGWGLCQISMAFLISAFLNSSQTASIIGYVVSIWATNIATTMSSTVYAFTALPKVLYLFPTFPFNRILYICTNACAYTSCVKDLWTAEDEIKDCTASLYIFALVYLVLALYLNQVVPQTYGVPKHPLFCLKRFKKRLPFLRKILGSKHDIEAASKEGEEETEDQDSLEEAKDVHALPHSDYYQYPLVVKEMRKVYPGYGGKKPKVANKSLTFKVLKGEIFGLLGPNGAGKTTLISMITGMYKPTSGNTWMAGYDIKNQLELVQLQIGVCPQFDILWHDLTVEEHLLFYARLKGIPQEEEQQMVTRALGEVELTEKRSVLTKFLPLGMKRRLSIAISLVANPHVVFLDEPTTGLDPETRRQLWNILQECRSDKQRAMVLTTHSMEEADVLCNRIAIVNNGVLRCIGSQARLKNLYGGGYHLFVNSQRSNHLLQLREKKKQEALRKGQQPGGEENADIGQVHQNISDFITSILPDTLLLREFNGNFVYQIPTEDFNAERLFNEMEKNKEKLKIADWGISQCTLEDVFTRICSEL